MPLLCLLIRTFFFSSKLILFPVPDTRMVATSSVPPVGGGTWQERGVLGRSGDWGNRINWPQPKSGRENGKNWVRWGSKSRSQKTSSQKKENNNQRFRAGAKRRNSKPRKLWMSYGQGLKFRGERFKGWSKSKITESKVRLQWASRGRVGK